MSYEKSCKIDFVRNFLPKNSNKIKKNYSVLCFSLLKKKNFLTNLSEPFANSLTNVFRNTTQLDRIGNWVSSGLVSLRWFAGFWLIISIKSIRSICEGTCRWYFTQRWFDDMLVVCLQKLHMQSFSVYRCLGWNFSGTMISLLSQRLKNWNPINYDVKYSFRIASAWEIFHNSRFLRLSEIFDSFSEKIRF